MGLPQGLYGAGGAGSVVFEPNSDLSRCPEGSAAPQGAAAVVLLADSGSGAAVLKRSLDGLMLLYSQASADIRAAFHLFIGLDGDDQDMQQLAHQYALDSLGTLKLVHHRSSSSSSRDLGAAIGPSEAQRNALRADHTRLMLHVFFNCFQYPSVLLLEDDWKLLPDFFEFFEATQWLLVRHQHPLGLNMIGLVAQWHTYTTAAHCSAACVVALNTTEFQLLTWVCATYLTQCVGDIQAQASQCMLDGWQAGNTACSIIAPI